MLSFPGKSRKHMFVLPIGKSLGVAIDVWFAGQFHGLLFCELLFDQRQFRLFLLDKSALELKKLFEVSTLIGIDFRLKSTLLLLRSNLCFVSTTID